MMGSFVGANLLELCFPNRTTETPNLIAFADNNEAVNRAQCKWDCYSVTQQTQGEHNLEAEMQLTVLESQHAKFDGHQDKKKKKLNKKTGEDECAG